MSRESCGVHVKLWREELRLRGITEQIELKWEIMVDKLGVLCKPDQMRWWHDKSNWLDWFDLEECRLHQIRGRFAEFKWFDWIKCKTIRVQKQNMSSSDSPGRMWEGGKKSPPRPNLCRTAAIIVDQLDIQLYAGWGAGGGSRPNTVHLLTVSMGDLKYTLLVLAKHKQAEHVRRWRRQTCQAFSSSARQAVGSHFSQAVLAYRK